MPDTQERRPPGAWRRRAALAGVVGVVVLVHALLTQGMVSQLEGLSGADEPGIKRMEATMVADMRLSAPPVVVTAPPPPAPVAAPAILSPAASAASQPASQPDAPDASPADEPEPTASAASAPDGAASEPVQLAGAAASASSAPSPAASTATEAVALGNTPAASAPADADTFEWPLATRVTFKAEGYFRGPIYGQAQVEWVREGLRYQVHVDASVGPSFAPIGSRRWTSEGEITPAGLEPKRFESINKLMIVSSGPRRLIFRQEQVELADGQHVPKLPMVQDPASHYIQLAYQALQDPALVRVGAAIPMPVALPNKQVTVIYDVLAQETLDTPLGKIDTFKLRPRPLPGDKDKTKEEILAEIWIAPSLQYLPIRMLLRQGELNYVDMKMDKRPQQTAAPRDKPVPPAEK